MKRKFTAICLATCFIIINISMAAAHINKNSSVINEQNTTYDFSDDYGIQWEMNFGSNRNYGARYEGPQPIGDCDGDGLNEVLVSGRDSSIRVFEWDEDKQTYLEMHTLHSPFYPEADSDAGGMAIGDLTGDGENEIAATWNAAVYKWVDGKYKVIGWNSWIFQNGGGNGDCYIGDCDNDGKNELIMSGGPLSEDSIVPEIVVFEWNGLYLARESEWDNPEQGYTYVYMAGMGDVDYDGENEIVLGSGFKVIVLDWNKQTKQFDSTVIDEKTPGNNYFPYPFACICKDSDMDGKAEINVGYHTPEISVFEWDGDSYVTKFEKSWEGEDSIIEALDVGDVDNDGINELCAGTNLVHILQWDGETYVEEAVLPTYGWLAVLNIGDCDNDGINELHAGSVGVDHGEDFMSWTFKYGLLPPDDVEETSTGSLIVKVERSSPGNPLGGGSVAAWNLETGTWYDISPRSYESGEYDRYDLPEGEYLLRATVEDYKAQEATITINAGEETSYTFSLQPKTKSTILIQRFSNLQFFRILEKIIDSYPLLRNLIQHFPVFDKTLI